MEHRTRDLLLILTSIIIGVIIILIFFNKKQNNLECIHTHVDSLTIEYCSKQVRCEYSEGDEYSMKICEFKKEVKNDKQRTKTTKH